MAKGLESGVRARTDRDEQGALSVLLAVCMTVVIGAGAIVIDAGQVWATRREAITAVDAAALAAAQVYAQHGNGCTSGTAAEYVGLNSDDVELTTCSRTGSGTRGSVTVAAAGAVNHQLAQFIGRNSTTVTASSTAYFGPASIVTGLRPFGLCSESPGYEAWVASGHSTTAVFRVPYVKDAPEDCGGNVPGNWALMDFNEGDNLLEELRSWIRHGYPGEVGLGWQDGDPGVFANAMDVGSVLDQQIYVPIFDTSQGAGNNAQFRLVGFAAIIVRDYRDKGAESSRYLDIQFTTAAISTTCCEGGARDAGLWAVGLCRVEGAGTCP